MTKKLVKNHLYELNVYDTFDGQTIDQVLTNLRAIKQNYPYSTKLILDVSYGGYDDGYSINLLEERLENDKEYKERLVFEEKEKQSKAKAKAKTEEKDRQEYERLKKKFEGV
jgi:hypothetical protein